MKKRPTKYLNYTIVCWVFTLASVIIESVCLGLYLAKWNGINIILYILSAIGFVFLGIGIAMIIAMNTSNDKSVKEENHYEKED